MRCGNVVISTIYINIALRRHDVGIKALSLHEVLYNYLIDGICFWVIFVVPSSAVAGMAELELFYHVYIAQCIPTTWRPQQIVLSNDVIVSLSTPLRRRYSQSEQ